MGAGVLLLLTTLLCCATLAAATTPPAVPDAVVAQHNYVYKSGGQSAAQDNLTWRLSTNDPDQTNGSLDYQIWANLTDTAGTPLGWRNLSGIGRFWAPIPQRASWVYYNPGIGSGFQPSYQYNITVTAADGTQSVGSCQVALNMDNGGSHDQCGNITIQPPTGLTALVNGTAFTAGRSGVIDSRWPISGDDPHLGSAYGDYAYYVNITRTLNGGTNPIPVQNATANFGNGHLPLITGTESNELDGSSLPNVDSGIFFLSTITTTIYAADVSGTHMWSAPSCTVTLKASDLNNTATCGNSTLLNGFTWPADLPTFGDGNPHFPGIDIATTSNAMGITGGALGIILGSILILAGAIGGYLIAKNAGTATGATLALTLAGLSNLYPMWLIVTIFLAMIALIAIILTRGGGD